MSQNWLDTFLIMAFFVVVRILLWVMMFSTALNDTLPADVDGLMLCVRVGMGNESVPIQLAQCWFPGLAISNAKI